MGGWIRFSDEQPLRLNVVFVRQHGRVQRVFAGWYDEGSWWSTVHPPGDASGRPFVVEMGDPSDADSWMPLRLSQQLLWADYSEAGPR